MARILEADGLDDLSTNAVAERAGVSVGSLYQYFPSKEALVGALISRETAFLLADAEAVEEAASGREAVTGLIAACMRHQFRQPELARRLDYEEGRMPFDAATRDVSARFEAVVSRVLQRADLPQQPDSAAAARDVAAIIKGMIDAAGGVGERDQQALAVRVGRAVFGYLSGVPTAESC